MSWSLIAGAFEPQIGHLVEIREEATGIGLSPQRYLWLRRMNLVRRALALANPNRLANSVTGIASDYGFTEFGCFSVQYRAMYGESPSATLRQSRV